MNSKQKELGFKYFIQNKKYIYTITDGNLSQLNKLSSFVNARLEDFFPEPDFFKPERFLNESKRYVYYQVENLFVLIVYKNYFNLK